MTPIPHPRLTVARALLLVVATTVRAHSAPPSSPSAQPPQPRYETISESIVVNSPVAAVWARVGAFCDITEWMNSPEWADCTYLQGHGALGSVRSIVDEVLVGQTEHSYVYAQPPRENTPYNFAHGALSAEPLSPGKTRLTYTMLRDTAVLPDEAARLRDTQRRQARCAAWLRNMKTLAEDGTLPPKPAGTLRPPPASPLLDPHPVYRSLPLSAVVNAPAEQVWSRIGRPCSTGDPRTCTVPSGKPGDVGDLPSTGPVVIVAGTSYSYTWAQPLSPDSPYPMLHGTVEARRRGTRHTLLLNTLVWDGTAAPSLAAQSREVETFRTVYTRSLRVMASPA